LLIVAPLKDENGRIQNFFGAQVDVSPLFGKHNDLSAVLSKDFAVSDCSQPSFDSPRKSFLRRLSDRAKKRQHPSPFSFTPLSSSAPGLEQEVLRDNITTIGEQLDVFRSAYGKVLSFHEAANYSISSSMLKLESSNLRQMLRNLYSPRAKVFLHSRSSLSSCRPSQISTLDPSNPYNVHLIIIRPPQFVSPPAHLLHLAQKSPCSTWRLATKSPQDPGKILPNLAVHVVRTGYQEVGLRRLTQLWLYI
jgi:hypothetical protein